MDQKVIKLLNERYFLEDETEWSHLAKRVSSIYPPSYNIINDMVFIPSSPTLMNANTNGKRKGTLSSCFTMGLEDSIEGIMNSMKEAALVTKASGGVGYVFSQLRSSKEGIKGLDGRLSSGPLPFANMFNATLDGIQQGGVRRGAGMFQYDINSPDILDVIRAKDKKGIMERFNVSIRVTDEFYTKLASNPDFPHIVYFKDGTSVPLEDNNQIVSVKQLWDEIIEYAWRCAEPGIFNVDIATRQCTTTNLDSVVLSNPCQEYTAIAYSSCNLGSINLTKFVVDGKFDWVGFKKAVRVATRYLDSVIDVNDFPIPKIEEVTKQVRPIGLGVMGFAHALYMMGIPFNSMTGIQFANDMSLILTLTGMDESADMALEKGAYPAYDEETFFKANERFFKLSGIGHENEKVLMIRNLEAKIRKQKIRNSCQSSFAPTGSISYLANTSGGIEPVFALTYARKIEKINKEYETVYISDPIFNKWLDEFTAGEEKIKNRILAKIAKDKGSCQNVEDIPEEFRKVFVVASDLTPMEHLESLAACTKNVSTSVSKTINLASDATREEISEVYIKAHEMGVIGVTVYRDGCREGILVHNVDKENNEVITRTNAPKRPKKLPCDVYRVNALNRATNESEKWIIFIGLLNNDPYEIIAGKITDIDFDHKITEGEMVKTKKDGKKVYQFEYNGQVIVENVQDAFLNELRAYITRLMSLALRHGAGIKYLKEVLQKSGTIVDFNSSIARAIGKYVKDVKSKEKCPACNEELIYVEGCIKCKNPQCSYTKCG